MTSSRLTSYGRWGARGIGICLIVSAFLRPDLPVMATDYLADLFQGTPWSAADALVWLLIVLAGVGLMALHRGACFLVYIAFTYSFVPWGPEFWVFPVTPFAKALLGGQAVANRVALDLLNGLFVLAVLGVHVTLAKASTVQVMRPVRLAILSGMAASIALSATALTIAVVRDAVPRSIQPILRWFGRMIPNNVEPITIIAYVVLLAVPLAIWGIPSFVVACVRLWRARRMRVQLQKDGEDTVCGGGEAAASSDGTAPTSRFRLTPILAGVVVVGVLIAISVSMWRNVTNPNRYQRRFDSMTAWADRIVVRDGGFNCCAPVDHQKILFEVTDAEDIAELQKHIQLVPGTPGGGCLCCGYPGIDWYRGSQRLALTSVQHGHAIRWKGFPGDAHLTEESRKALCDWLKRHGMSDEELR